jgi:hypothetical protein
VTIGAAVQAMLVGMPAPRDLHRSEVDGQVFVAVGATVLFSYAADDAGLRNLALQGRIEGGLHGGGIGDIESQLGGGGGNTVKRLHRPSRSHHRAPQRPSSTRRRPVR